VVRDRGERVVAGIEAKCVVRRPWLRSSPWRDGGTATSSREQCRPEQAASASAIVDEAHAAGLDGSNPVTVQAKMLRLELLRVKADLERELAKLVLECSDCGRTVRWVAGLVSRLDTGRTASPRRITHPRSEEREDLLTGWGTADRAFGCTPSPGFHDLVVPARDPWRYLRAAVVYSRARPSLCERTSTDPLSLTARRTIASIGMWSSPTTYQ
jgi:hypothetical protein